MTRHFNGSPVHVADPLRGLVAKWEDEAATLRTRYGDHRLASLAEAHANELLGALTETADELLTLADAAAESGYTVAHLRHMMARGQVPNAGRRGRPRILRGSLPIKHNRKRAHAVRAQDQIDSEVADLVADAIRRRRA